jgi:hypothetical protein
MRVGYARTSTFDQQAGFAGQLRELRVAGCEKLFQEQVSSVGKREMPAISARSSSARESFRRTLPKRMPFRCLLGVEAGHVEGEGRGGSAWLLPSFKAAGARHNHVREQQVHMDIVEKAERLAAVLCDHNDESVFSQKCGHGSRTCGSLSASRIMNWRSMHVT